MTITLPHIFKPRPYQLPILKALDKGIKRAVWCAHRRSGKDVTIFNWCIKKLYSEVCTCFYVMPSYAQGKKVIWDAVNNDGHRILEYIPNELISVKNVQEMKIRLNNGSLFQIIGSDNIDSLMGTNPKIVVFSEYALQDPSAWDYIRPILKVNKGVAIFISTPRGRNHFYDLYRMAKDNIEWFCERLTIDDTKVLNADDIEDERREGMSDELIQQEYFCSFDRGVEGSYYSKIIVKMHEQERIGLVPYDDYKLVHTAWDLGWDDSTAIIFFQLDGTGNVKIIDCEEHSSKTLAWYKDLLISKKYKYGSHLFPHDVEQIDGLSTGATRKEILEELGIEVTTVPKGLIADGIESVKALLSSRVYVDESKCKQLLKSLDQYHREWDDKHKVYNNKPRHDWSSHYCFTGDTKILTRNGTYRIMDLPNNGEVFTSCGWKQYINPRVTRRNAQLVEVKFVKGITVRCTPDHMFLTEEGWKSAESLIPFTKIQSSLMNSHNTSTVDCIDYGQEKNILQGVEKSSIEMFGKMHLVKYLKNVIYIIKMGIQKIINCLIWNVSTEENICLSTGKIIKKTEKTSFQKNVEIKLQNGILQKKEESGIVDMHFNLNHGLNGNTKKKNAGSVLRNLMVLLEKMVMNKNTVIQTAKPLIIESVKKINENEDVWCISVPDAKEFSLENGAIVHNCDAVRYLAVGLSKVQSSSGSVESDYKAVRAYWG